ncbi:MAG TPA: hypothetical protein VK509_14865, partial [Polyangiales bacterium]|nr:hypothetical protein [Polyangiales bacterium]
EQIFREQCAGSHWEQNIAALYRYTAIEQSGGFGALLDEAPIRAREALERDDRFGAAILTMFLTFSQLAQDQPQEALRFLAQERARHVGAYSAFDIWCGIRTAHALLYSGDYEKAHRHMQDQLARFDASSMARGRFYRGTLTWLAARCAMAAYPVTARRCAALNATRASCSPRASRTARRSGCCTSPKSSSGAATWTPRWCSSRAASRAAPICTRRCWRFTPSARSAS